MPTRDRPAVLRRSTAANRCTRRKPQAASPRGAAAVGARADEDGRRDGAESRRGCRGSAEDRPPKPDDEAEGERTRSAANANGNGDATAAAGGAGAGAGAAAERGEPREGAQRTSRTTLRPSTAVAHEDHDARLARRRCGSSQPQPRQEGADQPKAMRATDAVDAGAAAAAAAATGKAAMAKRRSGRPNGGDAEPGARSTPSRTCRPSAGSPV